MCLDFAYADFRRTEPYNDTPEGLRRTTWNKLCYYRHLELFDATNEGVGFVWDACECLFDLVRMSAAEVSSAQSLVHSVRASSGVALLEHLSSAWQLQLDNLPRFMPTPDVFQRQTWFTAAHVQLLSSFRGDRPEAFQGHEKRPLRHSATS